MFYCNVKVTEFDRTDPLNPAWVTGKVLSDCNHGLNLYFPSSARKQFGWWVAFCKGCGFAGKLARHGNGWIWRGSLEHNGKLLDVNITLQVSF